MIDGCIDMPVKYTPETVAPIIRFMYTGKLDLKGEGMFAKLRQTANSLDMSVLTKLMDAQLDAENTMDSQKKRKSCSKFKRRMEAMGHSWTIVFTVLIGI